MKNQTAFKSRDSVKHLCRIIGATDELRHMISSVLDDRFAFTDGDSCDLLITAEANTLVLSLPAGDSVSVIERPFTSGALRDAADSLISRAPAIAFYADADTCSAVCRDISVKLTKTEFRLYSAILEKCGELVSAEELSIAVWGRSDRNLCTVYLSYLRQKLDSAFGDGTLVCIRNKGYCLRNTNK